MKIRTFIGLLIICILHQNAVAQTMGVLLDQESAEREWEMLMATGTKPSIAHPNYAKSNLRRFVTKLKKKQNSFKSKQLFLNHVFYKTHRKYLHQYRQHATVVDLTNNGDFDCVSGTAFYAFLLNRLQIDYVIKEFDYHVLLVIRTEQETYLFESTDPLGGFVHQTEEIAERIDYYAREEIPSSLNQPVGEENPSLAPSGAINNNITFHELIGLHHFNNAVYFFNLRKAEKSMDEVSLAIEYYPSSRIKAFKALALETFIASGLIEPKSPEGLSELTATFSNEN